LPTYTTSSLNVGNHPITAQYVATTNFNGSTSSGVTQNVNPASTTTTLGDGSPHPSTYGQSVTFTASVAAAAPGSGTVTSGTVNFLDNGSVIGSGALNASGVATYTT